MESINSYGFDIDTGSNTGSNGADGDQMYDAAEDIAKMKVRLPPPMIENLVLGHRDIKDLIFKIFPLGVRY